LLLRLDPVYMLFQTVLIAGSIGAGVPWPPRSCVPLFIVALVFSPHHLSQFLVVRP
jgi:hypothetical protein